MEQKKAPKGEIKYKVTLNEEQKLVKSLAYNNQVVIVTGFAGSGKSLVCAQIALDLLFTKQIEDIYITRSLIEVGKTMGYLPGGLNEKLDPYIEAFRDNLYKCYDKVKIDELIKDEKIKNLPINFIRGKTVDSLLVVEEAANLTKHEMLAILTRLGKNGRIIINGDSNQQDILIGNNEENGLKYAISLSKRLDKIKYVKLKENHRSGLVQEILDLEYNK